MDKLFYVLCIACMIGLYALLIWQQRKTIDRHVADLGGKLIRTERGNNFEFDGPFKLRGKGTMVYKVEYEMNGITKIGWVKFDFLGGSDAWKL